MDALGQRAVFVKESLHKSQTITENVIEEDEPNEEYDDLDENEYWSPLLQQTRAKRNQIKPNKPEEFDRLFECLPNSLRPSNAGKQSEGGGKHSEKKSSETVTFSLPTLSPPRAIVKSKRSPEKLFVLLDMYEIMRELQPEIEILFESKACTEMKETTMNSAKRLAQTAQETFVDFEEAVEKDATKTTVM
ncbi:hypothetical protein Fmac_032310 [Flemingia macrophylla]|uniref:Exocyst subunit Exo70 family protein n=1 Tax=Flemingia macrophylla TaxID=520843 RepID=A0ABD1L4K9_9FABA